MSGGVDPLAWLAGLAHPRLALVTVVGAALVPIGLALAFLGPAAGVEAGRTGLRVAILGAIVFLIASTGYLAFALFEAAER